MTVHCQPTPQLSSWSTDRFSASRVDLRDAFTNQPPDPDFVLPGLPVGSVGAIVSPGATGKSYILATTCLSIATGLDLGEIWGETPVCGPVVYVGLEDPRDVMKTRLHAVGKVLPPSLREKAADNAHIILMLGEGFTVATRNQGQIVAHDALRALEAHLMTLRPRLLVLDTLIRCISTGGINESDNGEMAAVLALFEGVAARVGCAIIFAHHTSKSTSLNGLGDAPQAARGASTITDNARWQANLIGMSKEEASKLIKGNEGNRRRFVRLEVPKKNYGPPWRERWLYRGEGGVLTHRANGPDGRL